MATTLVRELDLPVIDLDGLTVAETASGAGNFALTGDLIQNGAGKYVAGVSKNGGVPFPGGIKLIIDTTGDSSGVLFTLTGTDPDDRPLVETKTSIASGATYETVGYFKTLTSFAADGAEAGNVTLGTVDEAHSATIVLDHYAPGPPAVTVTVTGTVNFDVKETWENVERLYRTASAVQTDIAFTDIVLDSLGGTIDFAAITASESKTIRAGAKALQLEVASYSTGARVELDLIQTMRGGN